jgi:hypothetical protein
MRSFVGTVGRDGQRGGTANQAGALVRVHSWSRRPARWSNNRFIVFDVGRAARLRVHSQSQGRPEPRENSGASSAITYVALLGSIAFVRVQGRVQGLVDHRGRRRGVRQGRVACACAERASRSAASARRAGIAQEFVGIEWLFMFCSSVCYLWCLWFGYYTPTVSGVCWESPVSCFPKWFLKLHGQPCQEGKCDTV